MDTITRERRHLDVGVIFSSQDPLSLPEELLPLLDGIGVFRHESSAWNRCLAKAQGAFELLNTKATKCLPKGMMWFWAREWLMLEQDLDGVTFKDAPILVETRPRCAHHGGKTKSYGDGAASQ